MAALTLGGSLRSRTRRKRWLRRVGFWLSVVVIVSPAVLVFLWMLSLSLKTEIDNLAYPPARAQRRGVPVLLGQELAVIASLCLSEDTESSWPRCMLNCIEI